MTEKDIHFLKKKFQTSKHLKPSSDLDQKILNKSKSHIEGLDTDLIQKKGFNYTNLQPYTAVALSFCMVATVFFGLSQLLDEQHNAADIVESSHNKSNQFTIIAESLSSTKSDVSKKSISQINELARPTRVKQPSIINTESTRNKILSQLELPSIDILISTMSFEFSQDRINAVESITLAMQDINQMIGTGDFNNARERYERLRQSCDYCQLPDSLDEFAKIDFKDVNRS